MKYKLVKFGDALIIPKAYRVIREGQDLLMEYEPFLRCERGPKIEGRKVPFKAVKC